MTRDEAVRRLGLRAHDMTTSDEMLVDLLLAVDAEGHARGYAEAQLRLEESVLTRVATEARRKALEEAVRICEDWGGKSDGSADDLRALIAKGGADV